MNLKCNNDKAQNSIALCGILRKNHNGIFLSAILVYIVYIFQWVNIRVQHYFIIHLAVCKRAYMIAIHTANRMVSHDAQ